MLLAASEAVGPAFVAGCLHRRAAAHKNPKVRAGATRGSCFRDLLVSALGQLTPYAFPCNWLHAHRRIHTNTITITHTRTHARAQVLTETLNWLGSALQDFGITCFDVAALLDWAKADLGSAVAATRTAAIAMVRPAAPCCWQARSQCRHADQKHGISKPLLQLLTYEPFSPSTAAGWHAHVSRSWQYVAPPR